ncbi:MAG: hypothetical protein MRY49_03305 [Candidatus Pacebacteria bacterium]|nr:hypothetical protein [Candidatus Paceibacterota bacterium]
MTRQITYPITISDAMHRSIQDIKDYFYLDSMEETVKLMISKGINYPQPISDEELAIIVALQKGKLLVTVGFDDNQNAQLETFKRNNAIEDDTLIAAYLGLVRGEQVYRDSLDQISLRQNTRTLVN